MRYDTFTRGIYTSYRASFDRTPAAALSVVLVVMTILLVAAEARTRGRAGHARTGAGTARPAVPVPLGRWRIPALAWCTAVTAVAVVTPLATLGYWLAVGTPRPGTRPGSSTRPAPPSASPPPVPPSPHSSHCPWG
ncbi:hypothetical protein WKI68_12630 [Streptomyces sp. MS1.HAVA.3]|uniref:ABC transmembrane type-1 domain-containing protein n=1 Tax=Streptomyces caledonius TaxID=3134107 RepID=A0ABU8U2I0_9ACTN